MNKRIILLTLTVLSLAAIIFIVPFNERGKASGVLNPITKSHSDELPNYDIRADKSATDKIAAYRAASARTAPQIADIRDEFISGETALRQRVPTLKVEYNSDIRTPEVITPEVNLGREFLTSGSNDKRSETLREFVKENNSLIGVSDTQADALKVTADYTNPDGNLGFAHLEQFINGVPVFRGEVKAGFTRNGEMIRVINNLAAGLDNENISTNFGEPVVAVRAASAFMNHELRAEDTEINRTFSTNTKVVFGGENPKSTIRNPQSIDWATTAEKMYFPTEPGVAIPAWRVLIWQPVNAFYVIVDANSGTMLWRKNITEDQMQSATYNVYANPNAMVNVADSPFPFTPGPISPNGTQGGALARTLITRVGNEAPYTFNNNGWITDGVNETDGNANEAGLDRDATNGVDVTNGRAVGAGRVFNFPVAPFNPNTNTGDSPVPAGEVVSPCASIAQPHGMNDAQRAAITQLFYTNNWYHDEMYRLGFTEQAFNFQHSNFGRGGAENDRVSGEAQDCSGTNNANFGTPADGGRGRMQMFLWTGPTPDSDGDFDVDIVIHEFTHGLSNRLHGNASGLTVNMSRGMGEGWSDFYGHAMLSEPTDPINGIYTTGAYATYLGGPGVNNAYYGIRRFPKAVRAFVGANTLPHNPMTFADIDATQINTSDGAFAPRFNTTADQVHAAGEVWSSALWEVRSKFVARLGWSVGNRRVLQFVTDGMKLAPLNPTFLQERDAIIAAAQASLPSPQASADVADIWAGFALRGMGVSATVNNPGHAGGGTARVTEAFDTPNLQQIAPITVLDVTGNGNGFAEPGELVTLNVPLFNNTGVDATSVNLQLVGGGGVSASPVLNNSTRVFPISFTIPAGTPCGSAITLNFNLTSSLGPVSFVRTLIVGVPQTTFAENFDGVTAPNLPAGWLTATSGVGTLFSTVTSAADSAPNAAFTPNSTAVGGASLTSPAIPVTATAATVTFRHSYNTEHSWDGGTFQISINGGAFNDIQAAGGRFIEGGYNTWLGPATGSPVTDRAGWSGNSNGFVTTKVQLPSAAAGQNVNLRWLFGTDSNTAAVGWWIDSVQVAGTYNCATTFVKSRADFDGDGRTDVSVYRPSEGNWYLNRSTAGFGTVNWGLSTDIPTPGDFDGDNRADAAVYRPSNGAWYVLRSSNGTATIVSFGLNGDIPQTGDYDGDNRADFGLFRPSSNIWFILASGGSTFVYGFGATGDVPVRGDYNGDNLTDVAIYRPSNNQWWIQNSGGGVSVTSFGTSGDKPVPADYDGDNKDDIAIYRPSTGAWWIARSSDATFAVVGFGISTDTPVPGDYDGDGRDDQAIYRGNGEWWLNRSTAGVTVVSFGLASDTPIPAKYIP